MQGRTKFANAKGRRRNQRLTSILGVHPHLCVADVRPPVAGIRPRVITTRRLVPTTPTLVAPVPVVDAPVPVPCPKYTMSIAKARSTQETERGGWKMRWTKRRYIGRR